MNSVVNIYITVSIDTPQLINSFCMLYAFSVLNAFYHSLCCIMGVVDYIYIPSLTHHSLLFDFQLFNYQVW